VIVVDQLRGPQWFTAAPAMAALLPKHRAAAARGSRSSATTRRVNDCTPARSTLLTGLYRTRRAA
jgi:hypothetical protein